MQHGDQHRDQGDAHKYNEIALFVQDQATEDGQKASDKPDFSGQSMGFLPNGFAFQGPGGADPDKIIGFDGLEIIAQDQVQDSDRNENKIGISHGLFLGAVQDVQGQQGHQTGED